MSRERGAGKGTLYGRLRCTAQLCITKPSHLSPNPQQPLMKEIVLGVQTVLFMVDEDAYVSVMVNQRLNTFFRKGCPGKEAYWLNTWGLSR